MERISFDFVGTTTAGLRLDPGEFMGRDRAGITYEIADLLGSVAPGVNFFPEDINHAAETLHSATKKALDGR